MRKLSKLFVGLLLVVLVSGVPLVFATESIVDEQVDDGSVQSFLDDYPSSGVYTSAIASTFTSGSTLFLSNVTAQFSYVAYDGASTADFNQYIMCEIRGVSGHDPNSTIFALSNNTMTENDVPEYPAKSNFTFIFTSGYQFRAEEYCVVFVCTYAFNVTTGQHIRIYCEAVGESGAYYCHEYFSSAWHGYGLDLQFTVYGTDDFGDVPEGTPYPTVSPTSVPGSLSDDALNVLLGQLFWWLAVLIIVLGPAFVFGVLFRGGTWGFLVGLLAGAGLGYWLMPSLVPLWLVVGVVFAVAAMAWSAMGRSS